ncbi:hypothetical protein [Glycomyces albidus]|jgi:hypothetical protein|uniref:Uncharacterized protein n=1 Tax=Glycomyces albidus TaxID=2656774 RepID=A0A6L5G6Z8_9ACTN|nr:hypothetical protein [Glycomyces albidus]MQM25420.1 hypothetical protein [Glycomyces albidus]
MVEMILAGVIVGAVAAAAVITGTRDRRRRKALDGLDGAAGHPEPIPGGWHASSAQNAGVTMGMDSGGDGF